MPVVPNRSAPLEGGLTATTALPAAAVASAPVASAAVGRSSSGSMGRRSGEPAYECHGKKQASILSFFARQQPLSSGAVGASKKRHSDSTTAAVQNAAKPTIAKTHFSTGKRRESRLSDGVCKREADGESTSLHPQQHLQATGTTATKAEKKTSPRLSMDARTSPRQFKGEALQSQQHELLHQEQQKPPSKQEGTGTDSEESVRRFKRLRRDRKLSENESPAADKVAADKAAADKACADRGEPTAETTGVSSTVDTKKLEQRLEKKNSSKSKIKGHKRSQLTIANGQIKVTARASTAGAASGRNKEPPHSQRRRSSSGSRSGSRSGSGNSSSEEESAQSENLGSDSSYSDSTGEEAVESDEDDESSFATSEDSADEQVTKKLRKGKFETSTRKASGRRDSGSPAKKGSTTHEEISGAAAVAKRGCGEAASMLEKNVTRASSDAWLMQKRFDAPKKTTAAMGPSSSRLEQDNESLAADSASEAVSCFPAAGPACEDTQLKKQQPQEQCTTRLPQSIHEEQHTSIVNESSQDEQQRRDKAAHTRSTVQGKLEQPSAAQSNQSPCHQLLAPPLSQQQPHRSHTRPAVAAATVKETISAPSETASSEEEIKRRLLSSPAARHSLHFRNYIEDYYKYYRRYSFPTWLQPHRMRDAAGRRALDCSSDYDFTTLHVPAADSTEGKQQQRPHFTPGMQQYWQVKKQHFDKLVLFKIGKFYEFVYGDACAAHRVLQLNWMGSSSSGTQQQSQLEEQQQQQALVKAHCGFPEQALHYQARMLVAAGYKLVVVEQTETPKELEQRNSSSSSKRDKAVRREVAEVLTAGTVRHPEMLGPSGQVLLSLFFGDEEEEEEVAEEQQSLPASTVMPAEAAARGGQHQQQTHAAATPAETPVATAEGSCAEFSDSQTKRDKAAKADRTDETGSGVVSAAEAEYLEGLELDEALDLCAGVDRQASQCCSKSSRGTSSSHAAAKVGTSRERRVFPGFAACIADVSTCRISLTRLRDNPAADWPALRLLLAQTLPAEIVYSPQNTPAAVLQLLRVLPYAPQLSPLVSAFNLLQSQAELDRYVAARLPSNNRSSNDRSSDKAGGLSTMQDGAAASVSFCLQQCEKFASLQCALGGLCGYLRSCHLDETVLPVAVYERQQQQEEQGQQLLLLDAQALQQLEVLQTQEGSTTHSLFGYIDRTATAFGHRLLRRWLVAPLQQPQHIEARLAAVAWLVQHAAAAAATKKTLSSFPDIERVSAKICAQSQQAKRKAVYFDRFHLKLLSEFLKLLDAFESFEKLAAQLHHALTASSRKTTTAALAAATGSAAIAVHKEAQLFAENDEKLQQQEAPPALLLRLCSHSSNTSSSEAVESEAAGFPQLAPLIDELRRCIAIDGEGNHIPAKGVLPEYDECVKKTEATIQALHEELNRLKVNWKMNSLAFVHSKFKYEIECVDTIRKDLLRDYKCDTTSTRKGFIRFRTPKTHALVEDLEDLEQQQKDLYYPFFAVVFQKFCRHFHSHFKKAIICASQIDCLQALAHVVLDHPRGSSSMCRPKILSRLENEPPILELKNCRHPVAETLLDNFVPNDLLLNTRRNSGEEGTRTLLLTGPNMGGKSTLLRQTCLCVILAQLGCFVPADSCTLTPVDKIFTRLGAEDFILQGASTFLVELRDVANLLANGTQYSLAVIDELGRGTSTFDGTAIALATLEYITDVLKCRCLFATHYHLLCVELENHVNIANFHMKAALSSDNKEISFLYKLAGGSCPSSHGTHVATLAGIPSHVIKCAEEKAARLQQQVVRQQRRWRLVCFASSLLKSCSTWTERKPFAEYFNECRKEFFDLLRDTEEAEETTQSDQQNCESS